VDRDRARSSDGEPDARHRRDGPATVDALTKEIRPWYPYQAAEVAARPAPDPAEFEAAIVAARDVARAAGETAETLNQEASTMELSRDVYQPQALMARARAVEAHSVQLALLNRLWELEGQPRD
jgi:hypothetical protein